MSEGIRVETAHNTPGDAKTLRIETTPEPTRTRRRSSGSDAGGSTGSSRPMVFDMNKSTTAILAIVMGLVFTLQVLALSQGAQEGNARLLTIAIAAGSGVLALLYFVISITRTNR